MAVTGLVLADEEHGLSAWALGLAALGSVVGGAATIAMLTTLLSALLAVLLAISLVTFAVVAVATTTARVAPAVLASILASVLASVLTSRLDIVALTLVVVDSDRSQDATSLAVLVVEDLDSAAIEALASEEALEGEA